MALLHVGPLYREFMQLKPPHRAAASKQLDSCNNKFNNTTQQQLNNKQSAATIDISQSALTPTTTVEASAAVITNSGGTTPTVDGVAPSSGAGGESKLLLPNEQGQDQEDGCVPMIDPALLQDALQEAVESVVLDLLCRSNRLAHARDRWLLKRLRKTLARFELGMASMLARDIDRRTRKASPSVAQKPDQLQRQRSTSERPYQNLTRNPTQNPTQNLTQNRHQCHRHGRRQVRHRRSSPAGTAFTACFQVRDSETVGNTAQAERHSATAKEIAEKDNNTECLQLAASQSNCNNCNNCNRDYNRASWMARRKRQLTKQVLRPTCSCSQEATVSTQTSCSIDSVTESGSGASYRSSKMSASTFPRYSPEQQQQPGSTAAGANAITTVDVNCNHQDRAARGRGGGRAAAPTKAASVIYDLDENHNVVSIANSHGRTGNIYSASGNGSRAAAAAAAAGKSRIYQCQQPSNSWDCGESFAASPQRRLKKPPTSATKKRRRAKRKKPRQEVGQQRGCKAGRGQWNSAGGSSGSCGGGGGCGGKFPCQSGERSCGECRPPRLVLCPSSCDRNGRPAFSRVRLQAQPGRFITRQVLFFDGELLYKPVRPMGPCY